MIRDDAGSSVYLSKVPKMQVFQNDIGWSVDTVDGLELDFGSPRSPDSCDGLCL